MAGPGAATGATARIRQLEADLALERGLREGAEKQLAACKKRVADLKQMQQDRAVEGTTSQAGPRGPRTGPDWAALPEDLLVKVAATLVAQKAAAEEAWLKEQGVSEEGLQRTLAIRKLDGPSLFAFAMVCKPWRRAQRKVGGPLRSRAVADVILTGRLDVVKWALAEGCPRDSSQEDGGQMVSTCSAAPGGRGLTRKKRIWPVSPPADAANIRSSSTWCSG